MLLTGLLATGLMAGAAWAIFQQIPERGFTWKEGKEIYGKVCGSCHDRTLGPVIRGRGLDPLYIRIIVRNGLLAMPAFRPSEFNEASLEKVARYVSKSSAGP